MEWSGVRWKTKGYVLVQVLRKVSALFLQILIKVFDEMRSRNLVTLS